MRASVRLAPALLCFLSAACGPCLSSESSNWAASNSGSPRSSGGRAPDGWGYKSPVQPPRPGEADRHSSSAPLSDDFFGDGEVDEFDYSYDSSIQIFGRRDNGGGGAAGGAAAMDDQVKKSQVLKLLALTNYGSVAGTFLFLVFRAVRHHEVASQIGNPVRRAAVRFLAMALILGNTGSFAGALFKRRGLKSGMKLMLSLDAFWEACDFTGNFIAISPLKNSAYVPREEIIASMFWNGIVAMLCVTFQKVNWM